MSWLPVHRRIYEPGHWLAPTDRDPSNRRDAWIDLCQMATAESRETAHSGVLQRGEIVVSVRTLAKRWHWSKSRVQRFVSDLEARTAIGTVRGTPDGTIYRIVNYDTYAVGGNGARDTKRDKVRDTSGTAAGQEQEVRSKETAYTSAFEEVWTLHRRGSKHKAFDEYRRAMKSGTDHATIVNGLTAYTRTLRDDFHGAHLFRWLKDERWHDAPTRNGQVSGALARPRVGL